MNAILDLLDKSCGVREDTGRYQNPHLKRQDNQNTSKEIGDTQGLFVCACHEGTFSARSITQKQMIR